MISKMKNKKLSGEEMLAKLSRKESKKIAPITIFNYEKTKKRSKAK